MTHEEKNKNRIIAASMTAGITGLLFLLVIMIVWAEPNPPLGGLDGVELNFGLDNQGFGEVQPDEPVGTGGSQPAEQRPAEPTPQPQAAQPEPEKSSEQLTADDDESPVVTKEKDEKKKEEKKEPIKEPVKEKEPEKVKPKTEQVTTPPKADPKAVYDPGASSTTASTKTGDGKSGKPGNHGDDPGTTGDKGSPQGKLDANALYGTPGNGGGGPGGNGSSLELSGWTWDTKPNPNLPNNESGRLTFEIKVDENGDIISIKTVERSVSAEAEQICRKAVEKLTFSKLGSSVPSVSTGKITFVVRSR
jgi:outer membrane biosynthesis protein TonB